MTVQEQEKKKWSQQSVPKPTPFYLLKVKIYLSRLPAVGRTISPCSCHACPEKTGWFLHNTLRKSNHRPGHPCAGLTVLSRAPHIPSMDTESWILLHHVDSKTTNSKEVVDKGSCYPTLKTPGDLRYTRKIRAFTETRFSFNTTFSILFQARKSDFLPIEGKLAQGMTEGSKSCTDHRRHKHMGTPDQQSLWSTQTSVDRGPSAETAVCLAMLFPNLEIWRRELGKYYALASPIQTYENLETVSFLLLWVYCPGI